MGAWRLSSKARAYLKHLLDRAADPTLEQRLAGLAAEAGPSMAPLLATFPDYASRIAQTRNVMAHQLPRPLKHPPRIGIARSSRLRRCVGSVLDQARSTIALNLKPLH
jgi:hypothetical protein